jgi:hypothetical protein
MPKFDVGDIVLVSGDAKDGEGRKVHFVGPVVAEVQSIVSPPGEACEYCVRRFGDDGGPSSQYVGEYYLTKIDGLRKADDDGEAERLAEKLADAGTKIAELEWELERHRGEGEILQAELDEATWGPHDRLKALGDARDLLSDEHATPEALIKLADYIRSGADQGAAERATEQGDESVVELVASAELEAIAGAIWAAHWGVDPRGWVGADEATKSQHREMAERFVDNLVRLSDPWAIGG